MRKHYDSENGTAALDLVEDAEIAKTIDTEAGVNLDFDEDGKLVSIEIWASDRIPEQFFHDSSADSQNVYELLEQFKQPDLEAAAYLVEIYGDPDSVSLESEQLDLVNYEQDKVEEVELARKDEIHLWLADLKKAMDFDSWEEAEGARKLVEQAGLELGTHGRQILEEKLEEDDGEGENSK